ncbi:hypothetical protein, partial [Butyricicoccus pullicaecorum]|uniref:hypothetical protein n=1 Tax=Butyricicoccus pullicaecorum TaxID=501571 RepID=UPI003990B789
PMRQLAAHKKDRPNLGRSFYKSCTASGSAVFLFWLIPVKRPESKGEFRACGLDQVSLGWTQGTRPLRIPIFACGREITS